VFNLFANLYLKAQEVEAVLRMVLLGEMGWLERTGVKYIFFYSYTHIYDLCT